MPKYNIIFNFLAPWHMGSGFGEGSNLDSVPVKSPAGLPYIPGRSVKGLFREAVMLAEDFGQVASETTCKLFGSRNEKMSRYDSSAGALRFSSATMGEAMENWASDCDEHGTRQNAMAVRNLYMPLASTQIDSKGLADTKHLRRIEIAIPLTLTALVEVNDDITGVVDSLNIAASLIRQAGAHRHRGLGRVAVSVKEVQL